MKLSISILLLSVGLAAQDPVDTQGWLDKGVQQLKASNYKDAAISFQKAVDLNPNDVAIRLYLTNAWMSQHGASVSEYVEIKTNVEIQLRQALRLDPRNSWALSSFASLLYERAESLTDPEQKLRKLKEAESEYEKLIEADPSNKQGYYSLALIDGSKSFATWSRKRADLRMKPEEPGPLPDPAKQDLKRQYGSTIDHGISNLEKALQIDPQYGDAMVYMSRLIRERADLAESTEQYRREVEIADHWLDKARQTKNTTTHAHPAAHRLRMDGKIAAANLIRNVAPMYPEDAKRAGVQGKVSFIVIIDREGHVQNMTLVRGHPMLVDAARKAVKQWVYKPTRLNGDSMELVTQIDVNFTLSK